MDTRDVLVASFNILHGEESRLDLHVRDENVVLGIGEEDVLLTKPKSTRDSAYAIV